MKKKQKTFMYKFSDCEKALGSSVEVKCTATGEKVKMYHRTLVSLIKKKYNNSWKTFESTYIKKGNKGKAVKVLNDDESYDTKPERYRQFLIMNYIYYKDNKNIPLSERSQKMNFYSECYRKRWGESIELLNNRANA